MTAKTIEQMAQKDGPAELDAAKALAMIRKGMFDALQRKDRAEYHRLGAEHRALLATRGPRR